MFGLTFCWMGNQMLATIFPLGIGHLLKSGFWSFIFRLCIVGLTFLLSAFGFLMTLKFLKLMVSQQFIIQLLNMIMLLALSCIPWLAYHISRIVFKPFTNFYHWKSIINNVDVLFIFSYLISFAFVFFFKWIFELLIKC
jgi:hypothetical protein